MEIELNRDEAEVLRDMLKQKVEELDKEINRTDSLDFKRQLQRSERAVERVLGRIATALDQARDRVE